MINLVFIILLGLIASTAFAGEGSGKVTVIYAHDKNNGDGVIMFNVENHINQPVDCPGSEWAFDVNNSHGRAMYALLLSAAAQDKPVIVKGAGDCGAWHDRERPYWIAINY